MELSRLSEEQKGNAKMVRDSGMRLGRMLDQATIFAGLGDGERLAKKLEHDLKSAVEDVLEHHRSKSPAFASRLSLSWQSHENFLVSMDASLFDVLLSNLIDNALAHSHHDIDVCVTPLMRPKNTVLVMIEIADEGPGIPEEDQERIFESFEKLETLGQSEMEGIGLGLSISRHMVEEMGGEIGVVSRPNGGANFWVAISMPCINRQQRETAPAIAGAA